MKHVLVIIIFCCPLMGLAQKKSCSPRVITSVGTVAGENSAAAALRVTAGVAFKNYFGGIGLGFDDYLFRSVPLYVDLRAYPGKKQRWFIYGRLGYNFPHHSESLDPSPFKSRNDFDGGVYADAGLGCKIFSWGKNSILFDAGLSYKETTNIVQYRYIGPNDDINLYRRHYELARVITTLSWQFGR